MSYAAMMDCGCAERWWMVNGPLLLIGSAAGHPCHEQPVYVTDGSITAN